MPMYRITLTRPATIVLRGTATVEADNAYDAHDAAENLLMQGSVDFAPDLDSLEPSRDHAAIIETTTEVA